MKREGIERVAYDLNHDLRFGRGGGSRSDRHHIEAVLLAAVRATLEEAARAVCSKCARNEHIADDGLHEPSLEECDAAPIWQMVAKLWPEEDDKEDEDE